MVQQTSGVKGVKRQLMGTGADGGAGRFWTDPGV